MLIKFNKSIKTNAEKTPTEVCVSSAFEDGTMKNVVCQLSHIDNWAEIKNATMTTIGKSTGAYPDAVWKWKLIMAEHSPIRKMKFSWRWENLPYWVSVHFVRHKIGIEHFVKTQRTDRTGVDRNSIAQNAPVNHECEADAQALINISRKRLCNCASQETRYAWEMVKEAVSVVEPELARCMVKECVYRGFCPEIFGCGYADTAQFEYERERYLNPDFEGWKLLLGGKIKT